MLLTTYIPWKLIDGSGPSIRTVVIPAGTYVIERVANPFGESNAPWLVLEGTTIGGSEDFFRSMDHRSYGEFRIHITNTTTNARQRPNVTGDSFTAVPFSFQSPTDGLTSA